MKSLSLWFQPNAQMATTPPTVDMLFRLLTSESDHGVTRGPDSEKHSVTELVLRCLVQMIKVIHSCCPEEVSPVSCSISLKTIMQEILIYDKLSILLWYTCIWVNKIKLSEKNKKNYVGVCYLCCPWVECHKRYESFKNCCLEVFSENFVFIKGCLECCIKPIIWAPELLHVALSKIIYWLEQSNKS